MFYSFICLTRMSVLPAHICVPLTCLVPMEARRGHGSPETEVADAYEMPGRFLELNPSPLEKQPVLLTIEILLKAPDLNSTSGLLKTTPLMLYK